MPKVTDEIVYSYTDDFKDELVINTFVVNNDPCVFVEINGQDEEENMSVEITSPRELERLISALQGAKDVLG